MKKKIVFFDGDGTLWYPRKTKYKKVPHWIYSLPGDYKEHANHLMMIPGVLSVLRKLKRMEIITVLLSTHPQVPKEADVVINHKIKHFKLDGLFDEVHATREYEGSKGEFMVEILKRRGIAKSRSLMVGDAYTWDYLSARGVGVDALLIFAEHRRDDIEYKRVRRKIESLREVFDYVR